MIFGTGAAIKSANVSDAGRAGAALAFDLIEEAADLVDGVSPAVGLALDELLQHREHARFVPGAHVLRGCPPRPGRA